MRMHVKKAIRHMRVSIVCSRIQLAKVRPGEEGGGEGHREEGGGGVREEGGGGVREEGGGGAP